MEHDWYHGSRHSKDVRHFSVLICFFLVFCVAIDSLTTIWLTTTTTNYKLKLILWWAAISRIQIWIRWMRPDRGEHLRRQTIPSNWWDRISCVTPVAAHQFPIPIVHTRISCNDVGRKRRADRALCNLNGIWNGMHYLRVTNESWRFLLCDSREFTDDVFAHIVVETLS